jgi:ABC-type uncharacterized transport system permease subunit
MTNAQISRLIRIGGALTVGVITGAACYEMDSPWMSIMCGMLLGLAGYHLGQYDHE